MNNNFIYSLRCSKFLPGSFKYLKVCGRTASTNKSSNEVTEYEGEKKEDWNILKAFSSRKSSFMELHRYGPFQGNSERIRMWIKKVSRDADLMDQRYLKKRHDILGNDLATAHFIVFRGGRVKFLGHSDWISKKKDDNDFKGFPKVFTEGWILEGVDASSLPLRYEGLRNLSGLYELKTLILRDCPNIDDWCVDRISGEYQESLECLDLSGCNLVTERSLSCIYRLKNLKNLRLNNIVKSRSFEFSCLLLEEAMPQLTIEGVEYLDIQNDKT